MERQSEVQNSVGPVAGGDDFDSPRTPETPFPLSRGTWTIREIYVLSWRRFREQWGRLVIALILMGIAIQVSDAFLQARLTGLYEDLPAGPVSEIPVYAVVFLSEVIQQVIQLGFYVMMLELLLEGGTGLRPLFSQGAKVTKVIGLTVAMWIVLWLPSIPWEYGLGLVIESLAVEEAAAVLSQDQAILLAVGLGLALIP